MDLVTGGTGLVGAHMLLELAAAGRPVRALHRKGADRTVIDRIFKHYRPDAADLLARIQWEEGDLMDVGALEEAMSGVQHVYHAAAVVSFDPRHGEELRRTNTQGTARVVDAALAAGVARLCHVSSTAAIGRGKKDEPRTEAMPWTDVAGNSDYAISKYEAELEVYRGIAEGLDAVIVNPCVVIGPGAKGRSSMTLVERMRKGTQWVPPGSNAFVDARDVAACMRTLIEKGGSGERYLLVGENATYDRLFAAFANAFGHPKPTKRLKPWMLETAWRLERVRSLFSSRGALVTKATAHSAITTRSYSNTKVVQAIGHNFRPLNEMVANVVTFVQGTGSAG